MADSIFEMRRDQLMSIDAVSLSRRAEVGTQLSFDIAAERTKAIQDILAEVDPAALKYVPQQIVQELQLILEQYLDVIDQISRFSARSPNAINERNMLEGQILNLYRDVFEKSSPVLVIANAMGLGNAFAEKLLSNRAEESHRLDTFLSEAKGRYAENENKIEIARKNAEKEADDLKSLLESLRVESADLIVVKSADHFAVAAGRYENSATLWLKSLFASAVLLLAVSVLFLVLATIGMYRGDDNSTIAQITVSKLAILGLIAFGVSVCARNYYAARHNQAVNEHRSNAISSYRALMEATSTPEHKDIVLTQVSQSVFSPQETAYVKGAGGVPELPTNIINAFGKP